MGGMDDLVQFLRARLDEDEQTARAAGGTWWAPPDLPGQVHDSGGVNIEAKLPSFAAHIARHDPARVLAEVDAKRQIIDWHERQCTCDPCTADGNELPNTGRPDGGYGDDCPTLRLLALPYADHPDYREEWRPTA